MELEIAGFPGAIRAPEDHGVSFIEKHLSCATSMLPWVIRDHLEDKSDVTNARPYVGQLPRWFWLCFVVKSRSQVPCNCGWILQPTNRIASSIEEFVWYQCRLTDELGRMSEF